METVKLTQDKNVMMPILKMVMDALQLASLNLAIHVQRLLNLVKKLSVVMGLLMVDSYVMIIIQSVEMAAQCIVWFSLEQHA